MLEAWNEYKIGINDGPSLQYLEATYGTKWRSSNSDTAFYTRRKPLYDEIKRLVASGVPEATAVERLQQKLEVSGSLSKLCRSIK